MKKIFLFLVIIGSFLSGCGTFLDNPFSSQTTPVNCYYNYCVDSIKAATESTYRDNLVLNSCPDFCFLGIIPGQTNRAEVDQLLNQTNLFIECGNNVPARSCNIDIGWNGDIVDQVTYQTFTMPLENLIKVYGVPDSIMITQRGGEVEPFFWYSAYHIQVGLRKTDISDHYSITSKTYVSFISYLSEKSYKDYTQYVTHWDKWEGYKDYPAKNILYYSTGW
jgi:hypothetical protein